MDEARQGDTVRVHYTGELEDGTIFDSSDGKEPLEFTIGQQQVIPGFESAVTGMSTGEVKRGAIPMAQAYGTRNEEMVLTVKHEDFPDGVVPEEGQQLTLQVSDEQTIPVAVTEVTTDSVTLDANHPLAGQDLIFNFELIEII